jgi:GNAT superfamily N-acetyltransferase
MAKDDRDAAILAAYDRERRELDVPGFARHATDSLTYHVPRAGSVGFVSYSRHRADEIDEVIARVVELFERAGVDFEWKVHDHDQPADLRARLESAGFEIGEPEALMVLPVAEAADLLNGGKRVKVKRVLDAAGFADYMTVVNEVWERPKWGTWLAEELRKDPDGMAAYVAYDGKEPAACARATFPAGGRFAGLWTGATRPAYRKRGFYTALVAARGRAAADRGFEYLQVDAAPTSRPILERLGFRRLGTSYACLWHRSG